jgi:hypothetical protein
MNYKLEKPPLKLKMLAQSLDLKEWHNRKKLAEDGGDII